MAAMVDRTCKCGCGAKFQARAADVARGWGKFASRGDDDAPYDHEEEWSAFI